MRYLKEERGSAVIYLLWILTTIIVISLIIINIARIYVVKQQASTAAQLGALAATNEILVATEETIKEFDDFMISNLSEGEVYDPLWDIISDRMDDLVANGYSRKKAYIQSLNEILPGRLSNPILKGFFDNKFKANSTLSTNIYNSVKKIVKENEGNEEHLEIKISTDKYRVEVKTDATYDSITDGEILELFTNNISQKGYGPKLKYLEFVLH